MELRQAAMADLLAHLSAKNRHLTHLDYNQLVDETLAGRVLCASRAGVPVALGGVFPPAAGGPCTCWFSVVPGAFRSGLPALVLAMRALLRVPAPASSPGLAAYVADANANGGRLARVLGFRPGGLVYGDVRQWRYGYADRQNAEAAAEARRGRAGRAA